VCKTSLKNKRLELVLVQVLVLVLPQLILLLLLLVLLLQRLCKEGAQVRKNPLEGEPDQGAKRKYANPIWVNTGDACIRRQVRTYTQ
jgi:hypothetical protein